MEEKLWADLKNDGERIEFLRSGRAVETGIVAAALVPELIQVFGFRKVLTEDYNINEGIGENDEHTEETGG